MKKILSILMLAAICANAQTTFTNGVKISALPQVSSISGTEIVVLNQSGTTKSATVNQLIAADVALINTVTNGLAALVATNGLKDTATTNGLEALIATNGVNDLNTSNALQSLISANTAKDTATTNGLAAMIATANAQNVATSNSIAGTATATAAAAVAPLSANAITNGGNGNFKNVTFSVLDNGNSVYQYAVNLSAATIQKVAFTNGLSGNCYLTVTNISPGQNVTIAVLNSTGATKAFFFPNSSQTNVFSITGAGQSQNIGNGKSVLFNFISIDGGNVAMSWAQEN